MLEKKYSVSNVVFNFSLELKHVLEKSAYFVELDRVYLNSKTRRV